MGKREHLISKKLSRLDFNRKKDEIQLTTYWCRVVYAEFERWNKKEHAHSFWELHLCLSGSAYIRANGVEYKLYENAYIFFCPKEKHTILFESDDYSEFVWGFHIEDSKETNEALCDTYKAVNVVNAPVEMISSVFRILENVKDSEFGYYDVVKSELYRIFVLLVRKAGFKSREVYHREKNSEANLIRKYIRENLSESLTAEDVASFFCVSKSSLERICKKEFGKSFSQIKSEVRAEVIRKLLNETDCTMEEIAARTGFSDRYAMGKFFKRLEGESPGSFRRGTRK